MSFKILLGDGLIEEKPIPIDNERIVLIKYNDGVRGDDYGRNFAPTRTISIYDKNNDLIFEKTEDNPYYWGEDKIYQEYYEASQEMMEEAEASGVQI